MPKKIIIPKNFENTFLIFYHLLENDTKDVLWFKSIKKAQKSNGEELSFYAVPASKYGIRIPKDATHWCLAILGGEKADILVEDEIGSPMTKSEYHLVDDVYVHFNRYSKNVKFMIGMSSEEYSKNKSKALNQSELKVITNLIN